MSDQKFSTTKTKPILDICEGFYTYLGMTPGIVLSYK